MSYTEPAPIERLLLKRDVKRIIPRNEFHHLAVDEERGFPSAYCSQSWVKS